jgi:hypothetical protein
MLDCQIGIRSFDKEVIPSHHFPLTYRQLMQAHRSEISALVTLHTKTLEGEKGCAEERCGIKQETMTCGSLTV